MSDAPALLLVDHDKLILTLLEEGLNEAGYGTEAVTDGSAAIAALEASPDRFRGIITDIRLGRGTSGWDIAHRARELSPHIQIVYVTADSGQDWASKGVPNSVVIMKPYALAQVVTAVSTLLVEDDARRGGQLS